jgi:hypothetical protein
VSHSAALRFKDCAPNDFRDLWDNGVTWGTNSVHPIGNPITTSAKEGLRYIGPPSQILSPSDIFAPRKCSEPRNRERPAPLDSFFPIVGRKSRFTAAGNPFRKFAISKRPRFCASFFLGVGNNPHAVPSVRRTNGGSWYAMPFRIIPELGQVSDNSVKPPSKECCDVLHDDVARS